MAPGGYKRDAGETEPPRTIEVSQEHLADIIAENVFLRERVDELLAHGNEVLSRVRGVAYQAREFRLKMGFRNPDVPEVPPDDQVRLACRLVVEEVVEFLSEAIPLGRPFFEGFGSACRDYVNRGRIGEPSLVGVARELADVDYVVEGARQTFGIAGAAIAAAVHAANMSKDPQVRDGDGKVIKAPGFVPPTAAIEAALRTQGMR